MKKIRICGICRKIIIGTDYRAGFGFVHHRVCHEKVYGIQFDD